MRLEVPVKAARRKLIVSGSFVGFLLERGEGGVSSTSPPLADEIRDVLHVARLENRHAVGRRFDRMDQHLSTARYARENTVHREVCARRACCLKKAKLCSIETFA